MELNRWTKSDKRTQLLNIKAELLRAAAWQGKDKEKFLASLERAMELASLSLSDNKWKGNLYTMLVLREEIIKFFVSQRKDNILSLANAI